MQKNEVINVVTTIAQIAEPLEFIGGDYIDVTSLMGPGVDPHLYNASQGDISTLGNADLVFYVGLNLEANMVDVFEQINKSGTAVAVGEAIGEGSLLEDEDNPGAPDPHVWFDITLWQQALDAAVEELKDYAPEYADTFEANKEAYFEELEQLMTESNEKLAEILAEKRILVTAHDAFNYFGRAFDIEVVGLQGLSTESEIGVSDIQETIEIILEHEVPAVFIESSVNDSSIKAVIEGAAETGHEVKLGGELYSDAMGDYGTEEGTYIGMYRHNVETIYNALMGEDE